MDIVGIVGFAALLGFIITIIDYLFHKRKRLKLKLETS
jgi:hypothetical protein